MINLPEEILSYRPTEYDEQCVDTVLHEIVSNDPILKEVFCNPPGGSWTQFDIEHPLQDETKYRWSHISRNPPGSVKRPDHVIQNISDSHIDIFSIESKSRVTALEEDIGQRLNEYFTLKRKNFIGIKHRPCWHKKVGEQSWEVIEPSESEDVRFWFRDYADIDLWSGFAFAVPMDSDSDKIEEKLNLTLSESDVDIGICTCWYNSENIWRIFLNFTNEFKNSTIQSALTQACRDHQIHNLDTVIL